jgi:lipopolysaccharide export system ATP-binding protein
VDPIAVHEVQQIIAGLKGKGLGILLTDHNVRETLRIVDRAYLIVHGKVVREGTSDFLINDAHSREIYLGPDFSM